MKSRERRPPKRTSWSVPPGADLQHRADASDYHVGRGEFEEIEERRNEVKRGIERLAVIQLKAMRCRNEKNVELPLVLAMFPSCAPVQSNMQALELGALERIKDDPQMTLLSAPIELTGDWGASTPEDALVVLSRTREVCLTDIRLLSDDQPAALRIESRSSGPPHIWLQSVTLAHVVVDGTARDWCRMTYQFGHELGHVLANSWQPNSYSLRPSTGSKKRWSKPSRFAVLR